MHDLPQKGPRRLQTTAEIRSANFEFLRFEPPARFRDKKDTDIDGAYFVLQDWGQGNSRGVNMRRYFLGAAALLFLSAAAKGQITTTGRLYPVEPPPAKVDEKAEPEEPSEEGALPAESAMDETSLPEAEEGPGIEDGGELNIMCRGGGSANKLSSATAWGWSSWGSSTATIFGERSQGFEDQVSLRMTADEGRLRMPRTMLPIIRGGKDGWFKLKDIKVKPNEITASIAVSAFNNPKLRLDRFSGAISISGKAGDYTGQCRKFDPAREEKRF